MCAEAQSTLVFEGFCVEEWWPSSYSLVQVVIVPVKQNKKKTWIAAPSGVWPAADDAEGTSWTYLSWFQSATLHQQETLYQ